MNNKIYRTSGVLIVVASLLACSGCGPNCPKATPVTGQVTFQGKPVVEGRIIFQPDHGRPAIGTIGPDGCYRLTTFETGDGALPGPYLVTIEATRVTGGSQPKSFQDEMQFMSSGRVPTVQWLVPGKYSRPETSPLTAEVKEGENTIDFDL